MMFLWWAIAVAIFPAVKVKTSWRNNNYYWRLLKNHCITLSNIVPDWPCPDSNRFLRRGKHIRGPRKKLYIFLRSSNKLWPIWNYIWENNWEQKWRASNRLLPRTKIILELEQWANGGTTREWGNLSSTFEKTTANENKYSRAGTINSVKTAKNSAKNCDLVYFSHICAH